MLCHNENAAPGDHFILVCFTWFIYDTGRNSLIVEYIEKSAGRFRTILVVTDRKAHVDILNLYMKDIFETITIHGEGLERSRKSKIEQIRAGHFKIVISTGILRTYFQ